MLVSSPSLCFGRKQAVCNQKSLILLYSGSSATQYWRGKVLEVAKDFPEYVFAVSDEEDYSSEIKDLGLLESGEDVNVAILDEGGKKYAMEPEEFDSDVLRQFVLAFKKGIVPKKKKAICFFYFHHFFPGIMATIKSYVQPYSALWLKTFG